MHNRTSVQGRAPIDMKKVKQVVKAKYWVPVTERALLVRVNRKLTKEGQESLKAAKGKARETLGAYYLLDLRSSTRL
jgi:hypothetical protein